MAVNTTTYPHFSRYRFLFGIFSFLFCALAFSQETHFFNVGYRVLDLEYEEGAHNKTLTVAVWYPTTAHTAAYRYGGTTHGKIAIDAPIAKPGAYPLLVFSHGYGGSGLGAVFLTEALAERGWIVACPDHHDTHSAVRIRSGQLQSFDRSGLLRHAKQISASQPADRAKYLYRVNELHRVLKGMLASDIFGQWIDQERVAVGGHSFGGFTALGLSGTLKEHYNATIKALLLFSTGAGGYLYTDDELHAVRMPSMLFLGEHEQTQQRGSVNMSHLSHKIFRNLAAPKYFLEIKGADHFSFNNRFSNTVGAKMLSGSDAEFAVIRHYAVAFLERYVAGKQDATEILSRSDPRLTRYLVEGETTPKTAPTQPPVR